MQEPLLPTIQKSQPAGAPQAYHSMLAEIDSDTKVDKPAGKGVPPMKRMDTDTSEVDEFVDAQG